MVLLKIRKRELICLSSLALTKDLYFRVLYLGNEWYGMRVEETKLSELIPEWPAWARDYESDTMEVTLHSKIGPRMTIQSEIPEAAHNFACKLFKANERKKQSIKTFLSRRKASSISKLA